MAKTPLAWMFTCPIFEKGKFYCAEGVLPAEKKHARYAIIG